MGSKRTMRRARARRRRGVHHGIPLGLDDVPAYVEISMKLTCRICRRSLDAEKDFYPRKGSKTGYQYECKSCRKDIKNAAKEKEKQRKEKEETKAKSKSTWNHREFHRKKLLTSSAEHIAAGEVIAETPRSLSFNLSLIVEQQLKLFYGKQINSATASLRMHKIVEDALFEVKQAFSRVGVRMKPVIDSEKVTVDLDVSLKTLGARASACRLLGVEATATQDEIKKAYREKALVAHPDHNGTTEEMQKINEAYALLVEDTHGR